ncbi:MAG: DUF3379 domain-containing protein [Gammaproteobacteria bacterium]|nr:DUF3379 domain-containing protein [Gammaproteobacteria bacterium]NNF60364.1 DUF3379 family protein [Gammaproteobacteria bacterium]
MNCIDYRRLITSEPSHIGADAMRHRMACRACADFTRETQQLDSHLRDAMMVETPADLEARVMLAATGQSRRRGRRVALAASVVVVFAAAFTVFNSYSPERLPRHVIKHLYHEAALLVPSETELVPRKRLVQVLERTGVRLTQDIDHVVHAGICYFRGHLVSHLVVNSEQGPVTVLLLPDEQVSKTMPIDEDGFLGLIVPVKGGSIAVIGSGATYPRPVEQKFIEAVEWST